jgi:hypothetical protein
MSVCWSNRITPQDAPEPQMFKSMNMIDPAGQAEAEPERRGLP